MGRVRTSHTGLMTAASLFWHPTATGAPRRRLARARFPGLHSVFGSAHATRLHIPFRFIRISPALRWVVGSERYCRKLYGWFLSALGSRLADAKRRSAKRHQPYEL
jgi:hypothetical protein